MVNERGHILTAISAVFKIQPGEGERVTLLLVHSFFVGLTLSFFFTAANAMFLAEFESTTLPYIYLLSAAVIILLGSIQSKIAARVPVTRFFSGILVALILFVCALYLGVRLLNTRWLIFGFLIWYSLIEITLSIEFWGLTTRLFDLRQGKRLFGLIGSGEIAGFLIGGFSVPIILQFTSTLNLLLIVIATLSLSLAMLIVIIRQRPPQLAIPEGKAANITSKTALNFFQNRYLMLIFFMFIISISGNYFINFILFAQMQLYFRGQDALAWFLGLFFGILQLLVFLIIIFLSGRLISRYGLRFGLWLLPMVFTSSVLLTAITGSVFGTEVSVFFWLVMFAKACEEVLRYTFEKPSLRVLYTPLPAEQRLAAQVVIEGWGAPLGAGLAGLTLLGFVWIGSALVTYLIYGMLVIFIIWVGLAILVYREYLIILRQALTKRNLSLISPIIADSSTLAVLRQDLFSPHPGVVVYALDILEELEPALLPTYLPELMEHRAVEVRLDVLRRVERLNLTAALPIIQMRVKYEGSRRVQGASLRVLAALGDSDTLEPIYGYLDHPDPHLCQGALVGLLRSGALEAMLTAGTKLLEWVKSPDPVQRQRAAQVLGEAGLASFYRPLLSLLRDEAVPVRLAALAAARKLPQPKLWPLVIESLTSSKTGAAAAVALAAAGAAVLPQLRAAFSQHSPNQEVLIRLIRLCGRIGGAEALALLKAQLDLPSAQARHEILLILSQNNYQATVAERARFEAGFKAEASQAARTLAILMALGHDESTARLRAALTELIYRHQARLFLWLACLFDPQIIRHVAEALGAGRPKANRVSPEQRAYALELLDVHLPATFKTLLHPWLDDLLPSQRQQLLQKLWPQPNRTCQQSLAEIITEPGEWYTPWTKICALETLAQLGLTELSAAVISILDTSQPLLGQTAVWTLARLDAVLYQEYAAGLWQNGHPQLLKAIQVIDTVQAGGKLMLMPMEKISYLKAIDFLAETPEETLAELVANLVEVELKAGETILTKNEINSAMYLIVEGQVEVREDERPGARLGENGIFGELSILNPAPQPAAVTALSDVRLLRLEQESLREWLEDHSEVAWRIMQRLAQRLQRSQGQGRLDPARDDLLGGLKEKLTRPI